MDYNKEKIRQKAIKNQIRDKVGYISFYDIETRKDIPIFAYNYETNRYELCYKSIIKAYNDLPYSNKSATGSITIYDI